MTRPVLLTGFEPFDGQPVNASWAAVQAVAEAWTSPVPLVLEPLPVSFRGARQRLRSLVAATSPRLVVGVGEAGGRAAVAIERVALNVVDARIPDNDGSAPVDLPVIAGAPTAYLSGLPVKACLLAGQATGVPVEVSNTAGTYVCNATFYALMHLLDRTEDVRGGFVHVPRTPGQVAPGEASMTTADAARALTAVLDVGLDGAEVRVSAGREA